MPNVFWPKADVDEMAADAARRDIEEKMASFELRQKEREPAQQPVAAQQPMSWDFSGLRSTLMPWDNTGQSQNTATAQQPTAQSVMPESWDFSGLRDSLNPWAPKLTPSGTPAAMPSNAPRTGGMDSTITQGPTGPALQPGESVGSVTLGDGPAASGIDNTSRATFARTAYPSMLKAAGGDPVLAEWMLAKAISENGDVGNGSDAFIGNNFSGIKGKGPTGKSFTARTWEMENGQRVPQDAEFAAFDTPEEGMAAFMNFLRDNSRYAPALQRYQQTGDARQLFQDINAAGYATNPNWWSDVDSIRANDVTPNVRGSVADARQSLNAGADAPTASAAPQATASAVPPAGSGPEQAMWSPDSPVQQGGAFQASAGRGSGQAIYSRVPGVVTPTEYDPRDADAGPHEAGAPAPPAPPADLSSASTYNDPTSGGTQTAPIKYPSNNATSVEQADSGPTSGYPSNNIVLQPNGTPPTANGQWEPWQTERTPAPNIELADGRTAPPTANGDYQPMRTIPKPDPTAMVAGTATEQPAASPLKPLYDMAGQIIGYVRDALTPGPEESLSPEEERPRNASVAGVPEGQRTLTTPPRPYVPSRGPVESTPGEPDYVPPERTTIMDQFEPGGALEPTGGATRQISRMSQIQRIAAQATGKPSITAVEDPAWRAANPELADEYDQLQMEFGVNTVANIDAPKFKGNPEKKLTVEVLRERMDKLRGLREEARASGDAGLEADANRLLAQYDGDLADALNARRDLEPAIASDVGRRAETLPQTEARAERTLTQDAQTGFSGQPARPDELSGPMSVPTDMAGRLNSAAPAALLGSGAGTEVDEDGNPVGYDPWKGITGAMIAGVLGRKGMNAAEREAWIKATQAAAKRGSPRAVEELAKVERAAQQAGLPGFEHIDPLTDIRRAGESIVPPAMTDAPNRARNLGDVSPSQLREPTLPGMDPLLDAPKPGAAEEIATGGRRAGMLQAPIPPTPDAIGQGILPGNSLNTPRVIVDNVIRQEQRQAKILARRAAQKSETAMQPGQIGLMPADPPGLVARMAQSVRDAVEPWERRLDIVRYAGVLSDTAAHVINAAGGATMQGVDVLSGPVAAAVDVARSRLTGKPRQVFFSETPARLSGMRAGWSIGLENAREVLRTGLSAADAAKQLDRDSAGFASGNKAVDFAFEAPLRALAAADAVFRTTAQGGHLAAEGMAAAMKANPGVKITPDMLREAMKDPELIARADKLAARTVLQEDRAVTRWWRQEVLGKAPPGVKTALSMEFMFTKTPYNVVAQGVGLTPAGLAGVIQDMAQHKPAREIEFRVARAALGTAVMGGAWADYSAGNLIGPRPTDEKEASTWPPGQIPWSRKVTVGGNGKTYYIPLAVLGPLAVPPVAAILLGESAKKGGDVQAKAARVAMGVGQYAAQNTFMEGITQVGKLFDPRGNVSSNLERHAEGIAAQFSPHIIGGGSLGREIQQILGMPARDPDGMIEALLATHPATAGQVEPAQDVLGRPRVPNVGGPLRVVARVGQQNDTGVIRAFRSAKEGLPLTAPKQIKDPNTEEMRALTPKQQHRWRRVFGSALQEGWNGDGNPTDADSLKSIESDARKAANETVLGLR